MTNFSLPIDLRLGITFLFDNEVCCEYYCGIGEKEEDWFGGWNNYASEDEDKYIQSILPNLKSKAQQQVLFVTLEDILKSDKSLILFTDYISDLKCQIKCELFFENIY